MRNLFLFTIVSIWFISCEKDSGVVLNESYYVDPRMEEYFLRFEQEGLGRGVSVDLFLAGIEGYIELLEQGVAGTCRFDPDEPRKVSIDQRFWQRANDMEREYVVFHELGHCFLDLPHNDGSLNDGTCQSIMESGMGSCKVNYSTSTRAFYLDQLFSN